MWVLAFGEDGSTIPAEVDDSMTDKLGERIGRSDV
jgi:hypothetical protein